ncbi:hypothetical protein [Mucilaginibacter kameinonensis]|uniref:hypothetical protein n=1 Tax=Mucilaginibacter kameinonensis TaxID=452286 RepID=UPI000EF8129C|nr:hypothetical protein [Mucilaginibacter kameinonensis]
MSLVLKLVVLAVLGALAVQDFKSRSVYWFWTPIMIFIFVGLNRARISDLNGYWLAVFCNLGFITLQLVILTCIFSLKKRRLINITEQMLGWGDILFLVSIAFYLSVLNFIFFYVISLIGVLLCWWLWHLISGGRHRFIPLAGFYAVFLFFLLAGDWFRFHINVTDDFWIWRTIYN